MPWPVNEYQGGLVLVSHDMRLISQIWICDNKTVTPYNGDIQNFKMDMRAQMGIDGEVKSVLRGDASVVKKDDETKKVVAPKKAPAPKLEVIPAPPSRSAFDMDPVKEVLPAPPTAPPPAAVSAAAAPAVAPSSAVGDAPKRYIPPHLRKKLEQG